MREAARRYAAVDATVLITGESGTGKEPLRPGHAQRQVAAPPGRSWRSTARRVAETLLESELFGHEVLN